MATGVLFDLFHTLTGIESECPDLPSTPDILGIDRAEWDAVLTECPRWRLTGEVRDGHQIVATLARLLRPAIGDDLIDRAVTARTERFRQGLKRIPLENIRLMHDLRRLGVKTALISNADAMEVAGWADSPLAGLFDAEVFSCHVGMVKPEPGIYQHALDRLQLRASECMFVGDGGSNELEGARSLGLETVFVSGVVAKLWPDRVEKRAAAATHRVDRPEEILGMKFIRQDR